MKKSFLVRGVAALGGLALSMGIAQGVASADPQVDAIVNTNCSYEQWVAALNSVNADAAAQFSKQPTGQQYVRKFLAAAPGSPERVRYAQMFQAMPGASKSYPILAQAFNACPNF